jgi:hypothetical protein
MAKGECLFCDFYADPVDGAFEAAFAMGFTIGRLEAKGSEVTMPCCKEHSDSLATALVEAGNSISMGDNGSEAG